MTLADSDPSGKSVAGPVVVIVLLIAAVIYGFGYARAVMHRANKDYKSTKAVVPVLRKGFWTAWWAATKVGFWVLLIVGCLVVWVVHGTDRGTDATPAPSPSTTPVRHTHR